MTLDEAIKSLMALQAKLAAYGHAMGLLFYDGATTAPKGTAANRGQTMSILSEEHYKLTTGEETVALLEFLDAHKSELDEKQQRMVFLLIKDIRNMQKIPMDEYVAYQQLLVEADDVWHRAKETSDFALFEPVLEKIFETNIRFAHYCTPEKDPYDYWLSEYEDGLTMAQCDEFFATLREHIVPLLKKIKEKPQVDDAMLHGHFSEEKQAQLSDYLMRTMGLDLDHVGLSTTEHPFTTSLGSHFDERITTHYLEENFASSMFSVIHEGGHALYDTGSADDLAYTVLDGGVSMGIHESQSRFYENLLGRSRAFTGFVFPKLCELFPELSGHTAEEFYRAINKAEPSLIRTEADELTYSLHIMVRYELEKALIQGTLAVADLPAAWNAKYKEYLGVDVPDDAHGCLQDIHWAMGDIGYFPSYALGSAYGAQAIDDLRKTHDFDAEWARGDMEPLKAALKERVWQWGSMKEPQWLVESLCGGPFDPHHFTDYLKRKYTELYAL
mgnify:CR=1 FL=1